MNPRIKTFQKDDDMPVGLLKLTVILETSTQRHVYEVRATEAFPLNDIVAFLIEDAKKTFHQHLQ